MKFYDVDVLSKLKSSDWPTALQSKAAAELIEAIPDGAALMSLDGKAHYLNRAFEQLTGVSLNDAGSERLTVLKSAGGILTGIGGSLERGKPLDTSGVLANGRKVAVSLRILRDDSDTPYGGLVVVRDWPELVGLKEKRSDQFRFRGDGVAAAPKFVSSKKLDELLAQGAAALSRNARLMLAGESGTGKTELARRLSDRISGSGAPFVHVNCGGIPESLFESEMFGYDAGAFTGAASRGKAGYVEVADGGVLFLDEVGEIPLHVQAKLLTFLENGAYLRVGSTTRRQVSVRVISATNRSLPQMIKEGSFRRDLYFRLAVVTLQLPSLRGQTELIRQLVDSHIALINETRQPQLSLSPPFMAALLEHQYPGNIRELANILEHAAATAHATADIEHLPSHFEEMVSDEDDGETFLEHDGKDASGSRSLPLKQLVREFETFVVEKAIAQHGSKRQAAKVLGVDIGTVVRKTKRS